MKRYNTSIKTIIQAKNEFQDKNGIRPIFLSDWDSDYNSICMPNFKFNEVTLPDVQKYYFWTDEEGYRNNIQAFFLNEFRHILPIENFTIGSNGTSSIMLALTALKEMGKNHALVLTPIYFSTLNLLDELEFDVTEYKLELNNDFAIDFDLIKENISKGKIDTFIITNPVFGSGIEFDIETIKILTQICNDYGVCIVMDYVYGGMPWHNNNKPYYIFNEPVYRAIATAQDYIFIESISKRIFLNGAKFSLVFSSPTIMRRILRLSVFMVGSMSQQQVGIIPQIYSTDMVETLAKLIADNAQLANMRYRMIKALLADSKCIISNTNCGYFTLISIPADGCNDMYFAIDVLQKTGVLTTPHSRYLYKETGRYSFRVNLLLDQESLIEGITKIRNLE